MTMRTFLAVSAITGGLLYSSTARSAGQQLPINGLTGTVALEGTVDKTYAGVNTVVVKTIDGIEHLFHLTDKTVVHGGTAVGDDARRGLGEGSRVVVHYTKEGQTTTPYEVDRIGGDGLTAVEGVIVRVDRHTRTLSIRLADGSQETLRLTERAASDVGSELDAAPAARVVAYVTDEAGLRVAHYFKRVP